MEDLIAREIELVHAFFAAWFAGRCLKEAAVLARQFVGRLDPGFLLIDPTGASIDADRLGRELWLGHGAGPDFELSADQIRCHHADGEIAIATYREWQRNAVRSSQVNNGRLATAVFRVDETAANRLRWVLVHETWLPASAVAERFGTA